ncbi:MAG: T9SS type A sorting domain-containing protein, partial [Bacteroidota bacterium]
GCYTVNITDANGCIGSASACVSFGTGIQNSFANNSSIIVYPNPATSEIKIKITAEQLKTIIELQLIDCQGKTIKIQSGKDLYDKESEEFVMPIENHSNGLYLIKILNSNNEIITKKITISNN